MPRLLHKIQPRIVALGAMLVLVLMVGFGMMVRSHTLGHDTFGLAGQLAYDIAGVPHTAKELLTGKDQMLATDGDTRFSGMSGWTRHDPAALAGVGGYLLISRFDGDIRRYVAELYDVSTAKRVRTWAPDFGDIFDGLVLDASYGISNSIKNNKFRIIHPVLFENGDLLIKDHDTPVARVNWCGERVWATPGAFHHSSEQGLDDTLWVSGLNRPSHVDMRNSEFHDDALVQLSGDGQVLASYSVAKILIDNNHLAQLIGMTFEDDPDPLHLNDIEPVLEDGPYWKKGDVFASLRHKSMLFQFRPSTGKIIWMQTGPWLFQHDVDILDDHRIAVFSNNMNPDAMNPPQDYSNRVIVYDFATGQTSDLQLGALKREQVRTRSEGLFSQLPGGAMLVEEENYGRLLLLAPGGDVAGEFINGAENGNVYRLGWSRYINRELGDKVLAATSGSECR